MLKKNSPEKSYSAKEYIFDGLVGPTHNYAGLSHGNIASLSNRNRTANPRLAALQGLEKMRFVFEKGIGQAILPPPSRPKISWLKSLGFGQNDETEIKDILKTASAYDETLLASAWSASSMWRANAATVSPSSDCGDGKLHFTIANLSTQIHRSLEAEETAVLFKKIFPGPHFIHHAPLYPAKNFSDEGAANHIRLMPQFGNVGLEIFVYGHSQKNSARDSSKKSLFPSRQSLEAAQAIARLHQLNPATTVFALQNQKAIDAGVFHNDVISVGHGPLFFCHEKSFQDQKKVLAEITAKFSALPQGKIPQPLNILEVTSKEVSLEAAISTYLFNSQILSLPDGGLLLLAALECAKNEATRKYLQSLPHRNTGITEIAFLDLRQSMRNGGGPACLRLRVVLTPSEWKAIPSGIKFSMPLLNELKNFVNKKYRTKIIPKDLLDGDFAKEAMDITEGIYKILELEF